MSKNEITSKKNNETGDSFSLETLFKAASPLMKEWSRGEVEKKRIESEIDKHVFDKDYSMKRYIIFSVTGFLILILCLVTFLFVSNKDKIAADILILTISSGISFVGGYGTAKSQFEEKG